MTKLPIKFYYNSDTQFTSGQIVETATYAGIEDKASHAYNKKFTSRTKFQNV